MFYVIWGVIIALCVVVDQVSKLLVVKNIPLNTGSVTVIPEVLEFIYVQNTGAAFGSMQDESSRWIFMTFSTVAIIAIMVYIFWKKPKSKLLCTALALIAGGGIGNMIDRIALKYVVDFINFIAFPKIWHFPFNVADSFVVVGSGLLILWMIIDTVREYKLEKQRKLEAAGVENAEGADVENTEAEVSDDQGAESGENE